MDFCVEITKRAGKVRRHDLSRLFLIHSDPETRINLVHLSQFCQVYQEVFNTHETKGPTKISSKDMYGRNILFDSQIVKIKMLIYS